jgi:hypothetical protein
MKKKKYVWVARDKEDSRTDGRTYLFTQKPIYNKRHGWIINGAGYVCMMNKNFIILKKHQCKKYELKECR